MAWKTLGPPTYPCGSIVKQNEPKLVTLNVTCGYESSWSCTW